MDSSDTASVIVDRGGVIHHWGDAVTEVVGYSADEVVGGNLNVIIPPALQPVHWWGFDQAMKTGRLDRELFKVPAVCKDGRLVVAHATIELIAAEDGTTNGAVVTFVGVGGKLATAVWRAALAPVNLVHRLLPLSSAGRPD
jgi:PAS domain S-box-containing protein